MDKKQVQKAIKIFTNRVRANFQPEKVILFGSHAYGETTDYSDVDIIVVSRKFNHIPPEKRLDVLYHLIEDLYPDFHVFGFTPDEYKQASPRTTLAEAKNRGVSLI